MSDEVAKPIAEELVHRKYRSRTPQRKDRDKLADYREQEHEDWVPEPPTY